MRAKPGECWEPSERSSKAGGKDESAPISEVSAHRSPGPGLGAAVWVSCGAAWGRSGGPAGALYLLARDAAAVAKGRGGGPASSAGLRAEGGDPWGTLAP